MRYLSTPGTITNDVWLRGFLTEDASLFVPPQGSPAQLRFRLEVWLDDRSRRLPVKQPEEANYFSVVATGAEFVQQVPDLQRGREVIVFGQLQSRDVFRPSDRGRHVVTEVAAFEIVLLASTRAEVLRSRQLPAAHLDPDRSRDERRAEHNG